MGSVLLRSFLQRLRPGVFENANNEEEWNNLIKDAELSFQIVLR